jgi:hypothetical protein
VGGTNTPSHTIPRQGRLIAGGPGAVTGDRGRSIELEVRDVSLTPIGRIDEALCRWTLKPAAKTEKSPHAHAHGLSSMRS